MSEERLARFHLNTPPRDGGQEEERYTSYCRREIETPRESSAVDEQTTFWSELLNMTKLAGQLDSPFKTKNLNIVSHIRHGLEKNQRGETLDGPDEELLGNLGTQQQIDPIHYWEDAFVKELFVDLLDWYLAPDPMTDTDKSLPQLLTEHIRNEGASILHLVSWNSVLV